LVKKLLHLLGASLGLANEDYILNASKHLDDPKISSQCTMRTLWYPPIPKDSQLHPGALRCAEHTDYGTITLLFQDMMGGLQVR